VHPAVLRVLVCLVIARGLLYRSKPSIEVTDVSAGVAEYKAVNPAPQRLERDPDFTSRGWRSRRLCLSRRYPSLRT